VGLDHQRTGKTLYLHERAVRTPLSAEEAAAQDARPDRMAIGGEGGFRTDKQRCAPPPHLSFPCAWRTARARTARARGREASVAAALPASAC
jgi:hypothetical protein